MDLRADPVNRFHGYHTSAGPLYRHVEDLYFRVELNGGPNSLVSDFAKYFTLKKRHFQKRLAKTGKTTKRLWVTMRHKRLKHLGARGDQLVIRRVDGRYSISYRTRFPGRARTELRSLLKGSYSGSTLITFELTGRKYQEFYACVRAADRKQLQRALRRVADSKKAQYQRVGIKTYYGRELRLPIGPRRQLPIAIVLYRPANTQTPHRVKLEVKAPSRRGRRVQVTEVARNRLVGLLRYLLSSALITAVPKPKKASGDDATWTGVQFKDRYKLGKNEKRVRFQFEQAQESNLSFAALMSGIRDVDHKVRTDNLSGTLEKMRKIGDVTLTKRKGKVRIVSPFDYSRITPFKASGEES